MSGTGDGLSVSAIPTWPLKAHKHVQSRASPVKEAREPKAEGQQPKRIRQQVIGAAVPAIGRAFDNPAHGVVPQIAISTRPSRAMTVLIKADRTNRNSEA